MSGCKMLCFQRNWFRADLCEMARSCSNLQQVDRLCKYVESSTIKVFYWGWVRVLLRNAFYLITILLIIKNNLVKQFLTSLFYLLSITILSSSIWQRRTGSAWRSTAASRRRLIIFQSDKSEVHSFFLRKAFTLLFSMDKIQSFTKNIVIGLFSYHYKRSVH